MDKDKNDFAHEKGEGIRGSRIVMRARKLGKPRLIQGSGRHKTNEIHGTENAEAWIEIPIRSVAEKKPDLE